VILLANPGGGADSPSWNPHKCDCSDGRLRKPINTTIAFPCRFPGPPDEWEIWASMGVLAQRPKFVDDLVTASLVGTTLSGSAGTGAKTA